MPPPSSEPTGREYRHKHFEKFYGRPPLPPGDGTKEVSGDTAEVVGELPSTRSIYEEWRAKRLAMKSSHLLSTSASHISSLLQTEKEKRGSWTAPTNSADDVSVSSESSPCVSDIPQQSSYSRRLSRSKLEGADGDEQPVPASVKRVVVDEQRLRSSPHTADGGPLTMSMSALEKGLIALSTAPPAESSILPDAPVHPDHPSSSSKKETVGVQDGIPQALQSTDALVQELSSQISRLFRTTHHHLPLGTVEAAESEFAVATACSQSGLAYLDQTFLPFLRNIIGEWEGGGKGEEVRAAPSPDLSLCHRFYSTKEQFERLSSTAALFSLPAVQLARVSGLGRGGATFPGSPLACVLPYSFRISPYTENHELVAGLAALAEACGAIHSIFSAHTPKHESLGIWVLWVCPYGVWMMLTIDSYLPGVVQPVPSSSSPLRCRFLGCYGVSTGITLWPSACEKAMAKLCGSYSLTCCVSTPQCISNFTGGPWEEWHWWKESPAEALEELEQALHSSCRGAAIVLLRTKYPSTASAPLPGKLRAATSYRVLAVSHSSKTGSPEVLLRLWHEKGSLSDPTETTSLWLSYGEVLTLFDTCHVCYDCRRFHDVRVLCFFTRDVVVLPNVFTSNHVFRVRLLPHTGKTAVLWIGMYQPHAVADQDGGGLTAPVNYNLGISLVCIEESEVHWGTVRSEPRFTAFAESYGGELKAHPSVWLFLELSSPQNRSEATTEFYIVPKLSAVCERSSQTPFRGGNVAPTSSVALLTPCRSAFDVAVCESPAELSAGQVLRQMDRVDFDLAQDISGSENLRCQVNGKWVSPFAW